ncbi:MAG TPA: UDP-4-amino-4,6-dideoxy-N-acetyl-beta-L-altrosamine transaminase [Opitutaceae bacterium]|nr:UDP-4-amino-4,6-dideoxy-N-acetyl-beta-L-altrosamine transaminase [Opitutaceae bacterium]
MTPVIPYGRQWISDADVEKVVAALRSDFLTCGPRVEEFEQRFAQFVGARYAVAMNSATGALHVALAVGGVKPGDRVVTSANTFLASANCAAFVGATPDFADVDPVSGNLAPQALAREWRTDTRAVIPVAYAGQPADMPAIAEIARARGALVVEDACHAVGSAFRHAGAEWRVGGHPWADMTVFSFHPVKTMTTGEGGMLVTDNDEWATRARQLRAHGMVRSGFEGLGVEGDAEISEQGPWYYEMRDLGWNYRLTDLQCALGLSQLDRLDAFIGRRREIVARYNAGLSGIDWLQTPGLAGPAVAELTSWHLYTVQIDFATLGRTRTAVMQELRAKGVGSQVLYIPVYLQPWYRRQFGYRAGKCPVAERNYRRTLSLPLYPAMTDEQVEHVIVTVRSLRN